jgi:cyclin-dependent kinase 7
MTWLRLALAWLDSGVLISSSIFAVMSINVQVCKDYLAKCAGTKYEVRGKLGSGSFGVVFNCAQPGEAQCVAVKLDRNAVVHGAMAVGEAMSAEMNVLRRLVHPHIIATKGAICDGEVIVGLVFDLAEMDLHSFALAENIHTQPVLSRQLSAHVAHAVAYMHDRGIAHMDLKPMNIVVWQQPTLIAKVIDFGAACRPPVAGDLVRTTTLYAAPEVLFRANVITTAADTWSLGCVVAELHIGAPLFMCSGVVTVGTEVGTMFEWARILGKPPKLHEWNDWIELPNTQQNALPELLPSRSHPALLGLLRSLLAFNPAERATAKAACLSAFFAIDGTKVAYWPWDQFSVAQSEGTVCALCAPEHCGCRGSSVCTTVAVAWAIQALRDKVVLVEEQALRKRCQDAACNMECCAGLVPIEFTRAEMQRQGVLGSCREDVLTCEGLRDALSNADVQCLIMTGIKCDAVLREDQTGDTFAIVKCGAFHGLDTHLHFGHLGASVVQSMSADAMSTWVFDECGLLASLGCATHAVSTVIVTQDIHVADSSIKRRRVSEPDHTFPELPDVPLGATAALPVAEVHQILSTSHVSESPGAQNAEGGRNPSQNSMPHEQAADQVQGQSLQHASEEEEHQESLNHRGRANSSRIGELILELRSLKAQLQTSLDCDDMPQAGVIKDRRDQIMRQLEQRSCGVCYMELPSQKAQKLLQEHWYHNPSNKTWRCAYCKSTAHAKTTGDPDRISLRLRASKELNCVLETLPQHATQKVRKLIQRASRMTTGDLGHGVGPRLGRSTKLFNEVAWWGQVVRTEKRLSLEPDMSEQQVAMQQSLIHVGFL